MSDRYSLFASNVSVTYVLDVIFLQVIILLLLLFSRPVMSDSLRPHGLQPTRLLRPWDFLGKSTGVGCHCLLQLQLYRLQKGI